MVKFKVLLSAAFLVIVSAIGYGVVAHAHDFRSSDTVTVDSHQKINHTLFATGNSVDVSSEVFGDVFCAGQTVTVSGKVHGDVICAGQTVNVTGDVEGDVRLAGQSVNVAGDVMGNATVTSQSFTLGSKAKITGDATIGSSDATLNGPVGRDLAVGGENVVIASAVGRDIKGEVDNLKLTSNARVLGNIDFTSDRGVNKASGAVVSGKITRSDVQADSKPRPEDAAGMAIGWYVYWLLAMLLVAMVLALLFPRLLHSVTDQAAGQPWKALLTGFVASIVVPIILVVLALTLVGLPLAFVAGLVWLVLILLSGPVFSYYVGRLILRGSRQPLLIMLVGTIVLVIAYAIPVIGFLAFLAAFWIGTGMLLLELARRLQKPVYNLGNPPRAVTNRKK